MNRSRFKQISADSQWADTGRRHQRSGKHSPRRGDRREQKRRSQRNFTVLCATGAVIGMVGAFAIHFTIAKVVIGGAIGLLGGLLIALLID